jgi:hypothetical protein
MTDTPDYFQSLPDARQEALAVHLHLRWQQHEARVAGWTDPTPRPWTSLEPDQQRSYRAMAVAAMEFLNEAWIAAIPSAERN